MEAKPLNIDRLMTDLPKNRVKKVGVELEGAWRNLPGPMSVQRDVSFFKNPETNKQELPPGMKHVGEIVSPAFFPKLMPAWVRKYYPHMIDHACGMHIHMSFTCLREYATLMVPEYEATLLEYLTRWGNRNRICDEHPLWERLKGTTEYCRRIHWPDKQAQAPGKDWDHNRDGHRYTVVNYGFGTHGTIECRVLPMFDSPDIAISALQEVINITRCSLVAATRKEKRITTRVVVSPNDRYYKKYVKVIR